MIVYWDTSAFALLYLPLPERSSATSVWERADLNLVSKLGVLECYRTFAALEARGVVSRAERRRAQEKLTADQAHLHARSVDGMLRGPALAKYLALLERHERLGTNDVLHLATALVWRGELKREVSMATMDRALAEAAGRERLGVSIPRA